MLSLKVIYRLSARLVLAALFLLPVFAGLPGPAAAAADSPGSVYTLTNAISGNEVLAYSRSADGALSFQGAFATGGLGSGAGLGSQGSVVLSRGNQWLFAVNAGSNQVSVFAVGPDGLDLIDVVDSGGVLPVSLANYQDWLYVLNAGGSGNITGFEIAPDGHLSPIAGSTRSLSNGGVGSAPGVAQISFTPDGRTLVVTEKTTNLIDTYLVEDGVASDPITHPSAGITPFGFAIDRQGHLVVSEAFGSQPGASALSSYVVDENTFEVISPSVGTTQTSACWVVISKNGNFAYTTNAGSGSISSYLLGPDGSLTLLNATAGLTGAGSSPIDMAFSGNGATLYALGSGTNTLSIFQMQADGGLGSMGSLNVPVGVVGLAAR